MLLDLTRIQGPREHVERTYRGTAFDTAQDDYRLAGEVSLSFDVEKKSERYRLVGRVTTILELPCSRCAETFRWPVDASFDVTYLPQVANVGEGEQEVAEEDLDSAFYEDQAIDLAQLMREQFYLSLPMKPLCSPDCKGLCPVCGVNRNAGGCNCDTAWHDPRMASLKGLLGGPPGEH